MKKHQAIYALNPTVATIRGDVAYDAQENIVEYDEQAVQAKMVELQQAEDQAQQEMDAQKTSALAKLSALGLSADEIKALTGVQA